MRVSPLPLRSAGRGPGPRLWGSAVGVPRPGTAQTLRLLSVSHRNQTRGEGAEPLPRMGGVGAGEAERETPRLHQARDSCVGRVSVLYFVYSKKDI